jgi:hypothetical protein
MKRRSVFRIVKLKASVHRPAFGAATPVISIMPTTGTSTPIVSVRIDDRIERVPETPASAH